MRAKKLNVREQHLGGQDESSSSGGDVLRSRTAQLVTKCRHYSAPMRKEAYLALSKQFKELQIQDVNRLLGTVSEAVAKSFIDEDESVRSIAIGLSHLLLKRTSESVLPAFLASWMQLCLLSLTHIEPGIRQDSLLFISAALDSKPALMIPYLVQILRQAATALSPRSARPVKKGARCELEIVMQMIRLYTTTATAKVDSSVYPEYTWAAQQTRCLRIVRPAPKTSGLEAIDSPLLALILTKALNALSDGWLELSESMNNVNNNKSAQMKPTVAATHTALNDLRQLVRAVDDGSDEAFWRSIPRSMLNVIGRDARQRLTSFLT